MLKRALCFSCVKVVARLTTISFNFWALGSKRLLIPGLDTATPQKRVTGSSTRPTACKATTVPPTLRVATNIRASRAASVMPQTFTKPASVQRVRADTTARHLVSDDRTNGALITRIYVLTKALVTEICGYNENIIYSGQ